MVLLLDIIKLTQFHDVSYQHGLTAKQSYQVSLHLVAFSYTVDGICLERNKHKYSNVNEDPQSLDFVPLDSDVLVTVLKQSNDKKQV